MGSCRESVVLSPHDHFGAEGGLPQQHRGLVQKTIPAIRIRRHGILDQGGGTETRAMGGSPPKATTLGADVPPGGVRKGAHPRQTIATTACQDRVALPGPPGIRKEAHSDLVRLGIGRGGRCMCPVCRWTPLPPSPTCAGSAATRLCLVAVSATRVLAVLLGADRLVSTPPIRA